MGFQYQLSFNAGQKYCRMLQGEHSAILSISVELPHGFKTFVLSIFEWPLELNIKKLMMKCLAYQLPLKTLIVLVILALVSEVLRQFSCSTQISMEFILLNNVKMPTFVGHLNIY